MASGKGVQKTKMEGWVKGESKTTKKEDDIVFETFYHKNGKEFQCIYQTGMRFYLDHLESKAWEPFPKRWYNEGLLMTNTILRDDGTKPKAPQHGTGVRKDQSTDDREGFIQHPTLGRVPTYIFYKKHNVHMYFDKKTGSWVRLPIQWELHHGMVKDLVDQVEEAVPSWNDRHDILAWLRACNYDPDECISIYKHLEKDEWIKVSQKTKKEKATEGMAKLTIAERGHSEQQSENQSHDREKDADNESFSTQSARRKVPTFVLSGKTHDDQSELASSGGLESGSSDDTEGFIVHPKKGRIPTCLFDKQQKVNMYFDKQTDSWVRVPFDVEMQSDMVNGLLEQVQQLVPDWKDRSAILASLRTCSYDPDECVSTYKKQDNDGWTQSPKPSGQAVNKDYKDKQIDILQKKVTEQESQLKRIAALTGIGKK